MNQKIIILDTTLRDGEQSLKTNLNVKKKLQIALALEKMGIDIIEIGFPVSSPGDFLSVKTLAGTIKNSKVCGLARCLDKDIDIAATALNAAISFRIHIFLSTSIIHIQSKLKKNFQDIIEMTKRSIKRARMYTDDIEFSCEDASRTHIDNLCRIVELAITTGANTINIPDTVGYSFPTQFSNIIYTLRNKVPNIDKAILSVHCHDDIGMAVGNSITAIQAGARQIEGTINGIGERAGNTALEEIIMAIKIHQNSLNVSTNINYQKIYKTCHIISKICNIPIPEHKSIIGKNAFSHSSGIHQDGILKNRKNYEIINPSTIGLYQKINFNLTSRSGRSAIKYCMFKLGYPESIYNINNLYNSFLKYSDKKGQVYDYELETLAFMPDKIHKSFNFFKLHKFYITIKSKDYSIVSIKLICGKILYTQTKTGKNIILTIYKILTNITNIPVKLKNYQLTLKNNKNNILNNEINITAEYKNRIFYGYHISPNIIKASIYAIINLLNNIWRTNEIKKKYLQSHIK